METNPIYDEQDYQRLLTAIFRCAVHDYVNLQHPHKRKRKQNQVAFATAVFMFNDPEYRFEHLQDGEGKDMSLTTLIATILDNDQPNMKKIYDYLLKESLLQENLQVRTLEIPKFIMVEGHVYYIQTHDDPTYKVDYVEKVLYLQEGNSEAEEQLVRAFLEIVLYHNDIALAKKHQETISKALFRVLRMNNCFVGNTGG